LRAAGDEARTASKTLVDKHTRLLAVAKKQLAKTDRNIDTQRKLVEANRDKLERLSGVEASLAESTAALAEKGVGK